MIDESESTLEKYIRNSLIENCDKIAVLTDNEVTHIDIYKRKNSAEKCILIQSRNRNDHVLRILKSKNLSNLPKVYEVCSCERTVLAIEEFIEGQTLKTILQCGCLSVNKACTYAIDVCTALNELHSLGIIHRDVNPSNIIVTTDDHAVLIDFSISRLMNNKKCGDTMNLGTVGYAAPEQFGIYQSGPATDIFAVGVLLNEMILGVHPTIDIPKGHIGKIINRCTAIQISKRFSTVNQLSNQLIRYTK